MRTLQPAATCPATFGRYDEPLDGEPGAKVVVPRARADRFERPHVPQVDFDSPSRGVKLGKFEGFFARGLLRFLGFLDRKGLLERFLAWPVHLVVKRGALGRPCKELEQVELKRVVGMIREERGAARSRRSWDTIGKAARDAVAPDGTATPIADPRFGRELEQVIGAKFTPGNKVKLLPDGPAAFDKRYRLIEKAKERLYVATFRVEDDATGVKFSQDMAAAARRGVDVRLLIDGKTAFRQPNTETLDVMREAGVKIAMWSDKRHPLLGLHSKVFVADDQAIVGGMNYGDCYSHGWQVQGAVDTYGWWRDTDMLAKGPAAAEAVGEFAARWNEVCDSADTLKAEHATLVDGARPSTIRIDRPKPNVPFPDTKVKNTDVAVVGHRAGPDGDMHLLNGTLKLIWGAAKQIDIENAYFIEMPPVQQALQAALDRGVKVRIHTNSTASVDEPIIAAPIARTMKDLMKCGAEVYLRKEKSLHSKLMVVDDRYTVVGSYNLNPRSLHYDCELSMIVRSPEFAEAVRKVFDQDIGATHADAPQTAEAIGGADSAVSRVMERFFYEHT